MIKFAVAALWISIATTAAMYFSFTAGQKPAEAAVAEDPNAFKGIDYVKTGIISVPVFNNGRVFGYFLARFVYTAETKRLAQLKLPADALIADRVYTWLYANPQINFATRENLDVDTLRETLRAGVNEKLGEELIREVLIEQIDFLPKEEVGTTRLPKTVPAAPAKAEPAATGH